MSHPSHRRQFLKTSATLGIGYFVAAGVRVAESRSPNERIAMASIGVGGKGGSDSNDAGKHGDMVAICDVDANTLNSAGEKRFPKAKRFRDFRELLDQMHRSIDAVTVSTADHTHAPAALMAMSLGKHCFCQKPLTRTIYEARLMAEVARQKKVATQMGNQGTASDGLRRSAALLRAGALGNVKEIHIWTNRPIWPQGRKRPTGEAPVPSNLDWDLWLGPAPQRPFLDKWPEEAGADTKAQKRRANVYHPFTWRGWWDFGTGALGDMGCHEINMPFMGLDLRNPVSVQAETSGHDRDMFPAWSIVTYEFAANSWRPGLKLFWYDGGKTPPAALCEGMKVGASGSLVIGDKGRAGGGRALNVEAKDVTFPKSPGHFEEWVESIRGGKPAMSNFPDYAGALAEVVLLGNLAVWSAPKGRGEKLLWDAKAMRVTNVQGLDRLIKPTYRPGYTLDA